MASSPVLRETLDLAPNDKKGQFLHHSSCIHTNPVRRPNPDLIFSLIQSLPRSLLSQVHEELTEVLRRDIIGDLPRELAVLIFVKLDTSSLLACGAVSRAWYAAANDQCAFGFGKIPLNPCADVFWLQHFGISAAPIMTSILIPQLHGGTSLCNEIASSDKNPKATHCKT